MILGECAVGGRRSDAWPCIASTGAVDPDDVSGKLVLAADDVVVHKVFCMTSSLADFAANACLKGKFEAG